MVDHVSTMIQFGRAFEEVHSILRPKKLDNVAITKSDFAYHNFMKFALIKISLLLHSIFCYISYEIIIIFCYISYEIILFSSLQLTPGGVFTNKS